jgi:hypothetical protein
MAIQAICDIESLSPYSQSKHYTTPEKLQKETAADYEKRTWRERMHYDDDGMVFIPPMAPKLCIAEAARFLGMKVPGRRNATYTKNFEAGILVLEGIPLEVEKDKVPGEWLFVPSDGKRGGGSRVDKCFPLIKKWAGRVIFHILDRTITRDVFETHLKESGNFIGLGRFRPRNNGYYGRFALKKLEWVEEEEEK